MTSKGCVPAWGSWRVVRVLAGLLLMPAAAPACSGPQRDTSSTSSGNVMADAGVAPDGAKPTHSDDKPSRTAADAASGGAEDADSAGAAGDSASHATGGASGQASTAGAGQGGSGGGPSTSRAGTDTDTDTNKGKNTAGASGKAAEADASRMRSACTGKDAGEMVCDKATLLRCAGGGGSADAMDVMDAMEAERCASEALCQAGVQSGVCAKCLPGSYTCDNTMLLMCDPSGEPRATGEPYNSPEACAAAAMTMTMTMTMGPVSGCRAGQYKCVDDTVRACDPASGAFVADPDATPCGTGLCNDQLGKCNECVPGSVACSDDARGLIVCSDDGQKRSMQGCEPSAPVCVSGACEACRLAGGGDTGCEAGSDCVRMDDKLVCLPAMDTAAGLEVEFCHAGACKVRLAPHHELHFMVDWSECQGSHAEAPLTADAAGIMLWPTTLVDLAIPLADSGWLCKLPPEHATGECIVSASYSSRELYIWGPAETGCNFVWRDTPDGIDALLGAGCGMCELEQKPDEDAASYAFNMGTDTSCRCPKVYFSAAPAPAE